IYISDTGCPGMAKAGSGDVLSGILSAVLASNYDKISNDKDMLAQCVCACAFINGKAGELNCEANNEFTMLSSETVTFLRRYLNETLYFRDVK
ncbi:MAG: hypothetical protein HUJ51_05345, partial [Eggerthellaceae bacterium]|nr:hypothetical protein [Eggerthellaceae bacterium]